MSDPLEDARRQSLRWRAVVSLYLRAAGCDATARPGVKHAADERFTITPDVAVPGWHIVASPVGWSKASAYLSRAVHAADEAGHGDVPVLCLPRQQHDEGDSYALLRLCDLARIIRERDDS